MRSHGSSRGGCHPGRRHGNRRPCRSRWHRRHGRPSHRRRAVRERRDRRARHGRNSCGRGPCGGNRRGRRRQRHRRRRPLRRNLGRPRNRTGDSAVCRSSGRRLRSQRGRSTWRLRTRRRLSPMGCLRDRRGRMLRPRRHRDMRPPCRGGMRTRRHRDRVGSRLHRIGPRRRCSVGDSRLSGMNPWCPGGARCSGLCRMGSRRNCSGVCTGLRRISRGYRSVGSRLGRMRSRWRWNGMRTRLRRMNSRRRCDGMRSGLSRIRSRRSLGRWHLRMGRAGRHSRQRRPSRLSTRGRRGLWRPRTRRNRSDGLGLPRHGHGRRRPRSRCGRWLRPRSHGCPRKLPSGGNGRSCGVQPRACSRQRRRPRAGSRGLRVSRHDGSGTCDRHLRVGMRNRSHRRR